MPDLTLVCWPWAMWEAWGCPVQGADCDRCGRAVARPLGPRPEQLVCLYCAGPLEEDDPTEGLGAPKGPWSNLPERVDA